MPDGWTKAYPIAAPIKGAVQGDATITASTPVKKEFKYPEYDLLLKSDLVKELPMLISVNKTRPMINITIAKDDTINGDWSWKPQPR